MFVTSNLRRSAIAALILSSGLSVPTFAHDGPHEAPPDAEVAAASLTNQMIGAMKALERASPDAKGKAQEQLQAVILQRQEKLLALVEKNPKLVLLKSLPGALRNKLPAALAANVEQEVDATGLLVGRIGDDFANKRARHDFFLEVPVDGKVQRISVNGADTSLSSDELHKLVGNQVTMRGMLLKDHLIVSDRSKVQLLAVGGRKSSSGGGTTTGSTSSVSSGPVDETTLVIMANFTDSSLSCDATDIGNRLFGSDPTIQSVNRLYDETSRQKVTFSGKVVGPFTIPYSANGACDYTGWGSALDAAAKAAGINMSGYRRISYAVPPNGSCGWAGLGYLGGSLPTRTWIASCGWTGAFAHELGHNLGFHHAATPTSEYGDNSDPMGAGPMVQFNASNRVAAGWQPAGTVVDASSSGSFTLTSLSLTSALTPQVLRLRKADTNEYYYVSLRTASGFDSNLNGYKDVVSVHRSPGTLGAKTYILATLAANQSFTDSANGITITPTSISGGGTTVAVTMNTPACTTASPAVTVSPSSQTGSPGATRQYSVTVTNTNGSTCASSTMSLAQSLPAGFAGSFSPSSVTLAPGASAAMSWSVTSGAAAPDASYVLTASASDSAASGGTSSASATYVVFSDSTPPSVTMLSPGNGSVLKRGRLALSANASDSDGIARVEFYADGVLVGSKNSAPYTVNWNARKVAPGDYPIKARAFDNAGNSAEAAVTVTLN